MDRNKRPSEISSEKWECVDKVENVQVNTNDPLVDDKYVSTGKIVQPQIYRNSEVSQCDNNASVTMKHHQFGNKLTSDPSVRVLNNHPSFQLDQLEDQKNNAKDELQINTNGQAVDVGDIASPKVGVVPKMKGSGELPIVERLPSRNISFQSAEILTIPELSQLIHIKTEKETDHVRVTGVILHLHLGMPINEAIRRADSSVNERNNSWMILGDALFVPQKKIVLPSNRRTRSIVTNPRIATKNNGIATKPKNIVMNGGGNRSKLGATPLLSGKKRKLITVKPNNNSLLGRGNGNSRILQNSKKASDKTKPNLATPSSRTSASLSASIGKQKPQSTHSLPTPNSRAALDRTLSRINEEVRQKSRRGMNMVVVNIANMSCIDGCKEGDLAMVMGSVVLLDDGDRKNSGSFGSNSAGEDAERSGATNDESLDIDTSSACSDSLDRVTKLVGTCQIRIMRDTDTKKDLNGDQTMPKSPLSAANYRSGYIDARILKVVNGTDMSLFQKALEMRREYLHNNI